MPHAEARVDSYADVPAFGRVDVGSSSSRPIFSRAEVMSVSAPRAEMPNAPSRTDVSEPLVFGREFSSNLADPAVARPSLAVRLGMKRSAASCWTRIVVLVLPPLDRMAPSFRGRSRAGVVVFVPVPTRVKSETPRSRCLGDLCALAMLDFGECAYANFETDLDTDLEKAVEVSRLCNDRSARGGVYGDDVDETLVATLVVLARGEGVKGIRPPAVFVLKMPWWLFRGVDTDAVAIISYGLCSWKGDDAL